MNNPDESWDFFVLEFSKSLRNSVKILIENSKMVFIFVFRKIVISKCLQIQITEIDKNYQNKNIIRCNIRYLTTSND